MSASMTDELTVEFAGEAFTVEPGAVFTVGREGDLAIDDNLFLHRHFLTIENVGGLWLLSNVGSRLSATVTDTGGRVQAWLAPGARLPLVFAATCGFMLWSSVEYARGLTVLGAAPVAAGMGLYALSRKRRGEDSRAVAAG